MCGRFWSLPVHLLCALDERGCLVMQSNSDTPLIRQLYARYRIDVVMAARNVNSRADKRGAVQEVVVRNY